MNRGLDLDAGHFFSTIKNSLTAIEDKDGRRCAKDAIDFSFGYLAFSSEGMYDWWAHPAISDANRKGEASSLSSYLSTRYSPEPVIGHS